MADTYSNESTRWKLPFPSLSDTPVDLNDLFAQRTAILDMFAQLDSGALADRPVSTSGTPGILGRMFIVTDQPDSPRVDFDYGSGWFTAGGLNSNHQAGDLIVSGATTRPGALLCDFSVVSATTYPGLGNAIGTGASSKYGAVAAGSIQLPDFRGRVVIGAGDGPLTTARTIGQTGGEETHLTTAAESGSNANTLTGTEREAHYHVPNNGNGWMYYTGSGAAANAWAGSAQGGSFSVGMIAVVGGSTSFEAQNHDHFLKARNADTAHNNMQPFGVANVFIKY